MRRVEISRRAWIDLDRLEAWLSDNDAPYASDLGIQLRNAILSLRDFPDRGRRAGVDELRELIVPFRSWSYVISYSATVSSVVIARIHHGFEDR